MKLKRIFIISGIIGAVGLILMLGALMMVNFNFDKMDLDSDYTEKTYSVKYDEASAISIYTKEIKVKVCYRDDLSDEIKITYYENDKHRPEIKNDNGKVTLMDRDDTVKQILKNIFGFDGIMHGIKRGRLEILVELPKDCDSLDIAIDTDNAAINAEGISAKRLDLKTSNGKISVSGEKFSEIYCDTSNAACVVKDVTSDRISLGTSNGSCDIIGIVKCKNIEVDTSNAKISCGKLDAETVRFKTSNGKIDMGNITAESLYADTSNAAVLAQLIESDNIEMYSSNGKIEAIIVGDVDDYSIKSGTSNGNNNIFDCGDRTKDKTLKAFTSNANINVKFKDK